MQSASMHYMYLVGLYSRRRCDFAGFVENMESCDLCILSCWGSSSSALICCAQLSWTCSVLQLLLNIRKQQEGTTCLLQSWHKTGFGNQARTNRHTSPSTGAKRQMKQPMSVCQIANHHHLPMHNIIDLAFFKPYMLLWKPKFSLTQKMQMTADPQITQTLNPAQIKVHTRIQTKVVCTMLFRLIFLDFPSPLRWSCGWQCAKSYNVGCPSRCAL